MHGSFTFPSAPTRCRPNNPSFLDPRPSSALINDADGLSSDCTSDQHPGLQAPALGRQETLLRLRGVQGHAREGEHKSASSTLTRATALERKKGLGVLLVLAEGFRWTFGLSRFCLLRTDLTLFLSPVPLLYRSTSRRSPARSSPTVSRPRPSSCAARACRGSSRSWLGTLCCRCASKAQ